jgi:CRP/FNR family transcriptional regulator, cyclic AMP receptor protein
MVFKWFQKEDPAKGGTAPHHASAERRVSGLSPEDQALMVDFLCLPSAVLPITPSQAALVATYLEPRHYEPGAVLLKEGDSQDVDYMLWILDGEVTIEGTLTSRQEPVTLTVLEAGRALGEMSFLDASPRSLTCTAYTPMRCAMLTGDALRQLTQQHPAVAASLLCTICIGISTRLRAFNLKFMRHVIVNHLMRQEIDSGSFHEEPLPSRLPLINHGSGGQ